MPHQISLAWDPAAGVDGYNLYRGNSRDNESNVPLNTGLIVGTSFVDSTVLPGFTYFYEVTAVLNGLESEDSLEVGSAEVPADPVLAPISLGKASGFGVLAGSTVTNTGPTDVVGDVGVSPGTSIVGFGPGTGSLTGAIHAGDFVAANAQLALTSAYNAAVAALNPGGAPATVLAGDIGGETLAPGVYKSSSSLGITGTLVLDGKNNPNAVWIFQIGSTLTVAGNVVLKGGAQEANIFWQVGSSATIGSGSVFAGNVLAQASITMVTSASVNGRLLARSGAVTLDSNEITLFQTSLLLRSWQPNTVYLAGQVLFDCPSQSIQVVTTPGTSGPNRPPFNATEGATTIDGSVIWTDPPNDVFVLTPAPPSSANAPPVAPLAPSNPHITSET